MLNTIAVGFNLYRFGIPFSLFKVLISILGRAKIYPASGVCGLSRLIRLYCVTSLCANRRECQQADPRPNSCSPWRWIGDKTTAALYVRRNLPTTLGTKCSTLRKIITGVADVYPFPRLQLPHSLSFYFFFFFLTSTNRKREKIRTILRIGNDLLNERLP